MLNSILSNIKIYIAFIISKIIRKYKNVWLISERGIDARDNGYFFYKYMAKNHQDIPFYYCITKDSVDANKIDKIHFVKTNSIKHGILYFSSIALVCTHPHFCKPNWKGLDRFQKKKLFLPIGKKIFLQHGITKDYIEGLTKQKLNADLFCCGGKPEYAYISKKYGYSNQEVQYTGFARFDNLISVQESNILLIMPTWREYMREYSSKEDFESSNYYKVYNSLLNNAKLINFVEKNNIMVIFYPHIEVQKWINSFFSKSEKIKISCMEKDDVQQLLIKCHSLVTDYSSVFFDVAYMRKKVFFYHFDYEDYRKTQYKEGYYNYEEGLGVIFYDEKSLVDSIIDNYYSKIDEKTLRRIDDFFPLYDKNNCERIYSKISEVIK